MLVRSHAWSWRAFAAIVVAGLVSIATACGGDDDADQGAQSDSNSNDNSSSNDSNSSGGEAADDSLDPVRIGYATVDQGSVGLPGSTAGATAAVDYINAELGGVNGRPVELVTCSVDLDPQSNQACGQEFANDADMHVVNAGFMFNGASFYSALESSGKPVVGTIPLNDADFGSQAMWWSAGQLIQGANVRLALIANPDAADIGMLRQDNPTGETSESQVRAALDELAPDAELTTSAVAQGSTDLVGAVSQLGEQDLIFLNLGGAACIQGIQAIESVAPDVPVVAGAACTNDGVVEQVGAAAIEGYYFASNSEIVTASSGLSENADVFNEKFPEYGDEQFAADPFAAQQWGITLTLREVLAGLDEAALADEATIHDAIESYTGPVFLGVEELSCPGTVEPGVCANAVRGYQVLDGHSVPLEGNEFIEVG